RAHGAAVAGRHRRRGGHLAAPRAAPHCPATHQRDGAAPPGHAPMSAEVLVLATSAGLFAIGSAGALLHRHPVAILMAIEVMLNAANLLIVLAARTRGSADAEAAALVVLVLAAAE